MRPRKGAYRDNLGRLRAAFAEAAGWPEPPDLMLAPEAADTTASTTMGTDSTSGTSGSGTSGSATGTMDMASLNQICSVVSGM